MHGNTIQLLVVLAAISAVYIFTCSFYMRYWVNDGTEHQTRMLSRLRIYGVMKRTARYAVIFSVIVESFKTSAVPLARRIPLKMQNINKATRCSRWLSHRHLNLTTTIRQVVVYAGRREVALSRALFTSRIAVRADIL